MGARLILDIGEVLLKREYDYFAKFITWAEALALGRRLQRVGSRTPRPLLRRSGRLSVSCEGQGRMWSVSPGLGSAEINPELSEHHQSADNTEPTIILSSQSLQHQPEGVEEQRCCLFLTKCIVCYWQFCVNLKNNKNQYWFMTLWLALGGSHESGLPWLPSAGNCSQITGRVSLKADWILLSEPGAITTW